MNSNTCIRGVDTILSQDVDTWGCLAACPQVRVCGHRLRPRQNDGFRLWHTAPLQSSSLLKALYSCSMLTHSLSALLRTLMLSSVQHYITTLLFCIV